MHIKDTLPHRYPFLMIDKVTNVKQRESVTGYKLITNNEWFINDSQKTYASYVNCRGTCSA